MFGYEVEGNIYVGDIVSLSEEDKNLYKQSKYLYFRNECFFCFLLIPLSLGGGGWGSGINHIGYAHM